MLLIFIVKFQLQYEIIKFIHAQSLLKRFFKNLIQTNKNIDNIYINILMKVRILIFILVLLGIFSISSNTPIKMRKPNGLTHHTHQINSHSFDKFFGAEIHFSRIPHQYWEHRLQMVKSLGFNALSIYIMWNFHQIQKGKFDYENGDKNLKGFMELTKKYGFKVLFRPGPYVCAQWDFGGLPARLLANKNLEIRANNQPFLDQVKIYFASLAQIMNQYSQANGGNIIMLQIQNQYGWYGTDKSYMQAIRQLWKDVNVDLPECYVDWPQNIQKCHWEGANIGINNGIKQQEWIEVRKMEPNGFLFGGQIYSGWMTHWGEQWGGKTIQDFTKQFDFLMTYNHSFSMYMVHGGSNFALTAGANGFQNRSFDYGGHVTTYDYDSPINEQGSPTQKFHIFRQLAKKHATWQIPQVPASIKTISIKNFILSAFADLFQNLPQPSIKQSKQLIYFEDQRLKMWNQGFVAYQTTLGEGKYQITLRVHDFALIFVNGQFMQTVDRGEKIQHVVKFQASKYVNKLVILVEAMGHINFGAQMLTDYKGIISFKVQFTPMGQQKSEKKTLLKDDSFLWDIYKIPVDKSMLSWKNKSATNTFPRLFRYNLTLQQVGDTYLNMQNWKKGYVFVNGYNLGRYWNKGPQQKIFLPGVWLKKGDNDIVVLELLMSSAKFIKGDKQLYDAKQQTTTKHNANSDGNLWEVIKTD